MKILCLKVGEMGTNSYLVVDETTQEALVIDPGDEGDFISTSILENKITPIGIVLTHGHYDHCLAALELKLNFNIPIYLHPKDLFLYEKAHLSANHFSNITSPKLLPIDEFLTDGQVLCFGDSSLRVIHTPGHTPGSCCFTNEVLVNKEKLHTAQSIIFTGDTYFASGPGQADRSYSSAPQLRKSTQKIRERYPDALIYPGHEDHGVFIRR